MKELLAKEPRVPQLSPLSPYVSF